jgi:adenine-specific DNA-methyltransferase
VVTHHQDVPYRVLEHKYGFTVDNGEQPELTNSGNKIIHGDNLEALEFMARKNIIFKKIPRDITKF